MKALRRSSPSEDPRETAFLSTRRRFRTGVFRTGCSARSPVGTRRSAPRPHPVRQQRLQDRACPPDRRGPCPGAHPVVAHRGLRTFVLDTSVLLSDPGALGRFAEHEVVLPLVVISELEGKRHHPELGWFARQTLRALDELRIKHGRLDAPVPIGDGGGMLHVELNHSDLASLPAGFRVDSNDSRILAVSLNLAAEGRAVTLVTKDMPLRVKAAAVGLPADEYRTHPAVDLGWTGMSELDVSVETIDALYQGEPVSLVETDAFAGVADMPCHTGLVLHSAHGSALGRITPTSRCGWSAATARRSACTVARPSSASPWTCCSTPRSASSRSAAGRAPASRRWPSARAWRPFSSGAPTSGSSSSGRCTPWVARNSATCPAASEKMTPWAQAVFDTLGALVSSDVMDEVMDRGMLEVLPLTHIRGRSLHDSFVIVDEAQSLERNVLLTVLSRIGSGSRVVLTHDVAQRDNLRVGRHDGIAAVIEALRGHPLFAHVTLTRSERSPIAALVTEMLEDLPL